jgi:hypothetical protein
MGQYLNANAATIGTITTDTNSSDIPAIGPW